MKLSLLNLAPNISFSFINLSNFLSSLNFSSLGSISPSKGIITFRSSRAKTEEGRSSEASVFQLISDKLQRLEIYTFNFSNLFLLVLSSPFTKALILVEGLISSSPLIFLIPVIISFVHSIS